MTIHPPRLVETTIEQFPLVQNMAMFYVYDISCHCCSYSKCVTPPFSSLDLKDYFLSGNKKALLIYADEILAGYILLYQLSPNLPIQWHLDEFFILNEFRGTDLPLMSLSQLWQCFPGRWTISVESGNQRSLAFWRKALHKTVSKEIIENRQQEKDSSGDLKDYEIFSFTIEH